MPVLAALALIVTDLQVVDDANTTLVPAVVTSVLPFNTVVGATSTVFTLLVMPVRVVTVPTFHVPDCAACTANVPALVTAWDGTEASDTGWVACQNVPVTGVVGAVASDTGTAEALSCVSVSPPVVTVPDTGTGVARNSVSVSPVVGVSAVTSSLDNVTARLEALAFCPSDVGNKAISEVNLCAIRCKRPLRPDCAVSSAGAVSVSSPSLVETSLNVLLLCDVLVSINGKFV